MPVPENAGVLESLRTKARASVQRIVLPESHDPRVVQAAIKLADQGLATPILVNYDGTSLPDHVEVVHSSDSEITHQCGQQLFRKPQTQRAVFRSRNGSGTRSAVVRRDPGQKRRRRRLCRRKCCHDGQRHSGGLVRRGNSNRVVKSFPVFS